MLELKVCITPTWQEVYFLKLSPNPFSTAQPSQGQREFHFLRVDLLRLMSAIQALVPTQWPFLCCVCLAQEDQSECPLLLGRPLGTVGVCVYGGGALTLMAEIKVKLDK